MANHLKGEVEVSADGKAYVFRLGINELIHFQGDMGLEGEDHKLWEVFDHLTVPGLVALVRRGLQRDQPWFTVEAAANFITKLGLKDANDMVVRGLRWALPDKKEGTGAAGKGGARTPFRWRRVFVDAARAGLTPEQVHASTLREVLMQIEAWGWRMNQERRGAAQTAWLTATLGKSKHMRLETLMRQMFPEKMTPQQEAQLWREWAQRNNLKVKHHKAPVH